MSATSERPIGAMGEEERERILQERVLPHFRRLEAGAIPNSPSAILVGGQPGSGKSALLVQSTRELQATGATWQINGDDFYGFHPQYAALQRTQGARAAELVKADANYWTHQTLLAAQARGVNVVMETTLRQPNLVAATLKSLKAQGYTTQVRVLAVKKEISWQGNALRREMLSIGKSATRLADRATHDGAYKGVVATVSHLQAERLADRVTIHGRGRGASVAPLLYVSKGKSQDAAQVIEGIRGRPLTNAGVEAHWQVWDRVHGLAAGRHERDGLQPGAARAELTVMRAEQVLDDHKLRSEQARERDRDLRGSKKDKGGRTDLAEALRELPREEAIRRNPQLAAAYVLIDVAVAASKATPETRAQIVEQMRDRLAAHLERGGKVPAAEVTRMDGPTVGKANSPKPQGDDRER